MVKFSEVYRNVRLGDAALIRKEIEKHVSSATFLNWQRGSFEPDSRWWSVLNEIFASFGYDKPYSL